MGSVDMIEDPTLNRFRKKPETSKWNRPSRLQKSLITALVLLLCSSTLGASNVKRLRCKEKNCFSQDSWETTSPENTEIGTQTEDAFAGPRNPRKEAVVESFKHAWKGYKKHAWGHDHLKPVSGTGHSTNSLGLTIVDSLDTAYIMGLTEEQRITLQALSALTQDDLKDLIPQIGTRVLFTRCWRTWKNEFSPVVDITNNIQTFSGLDLPNLQLDLELPNYQRDSSDYILMTVKDPEVEKENTSIVPILEPQNEVCLQLCPNKSLVHVNWATVSTTRYIKEFEEGRQWIKDKLIFTKTGDVSLFEVTIKVLGGLLTNYHFTQDEMFLNKAKDLGERLMPAFSSPSGIPYPYVNLGTKTASAGWRTSSSTSEVTTLQLEFRELARTTGNLTFEHAAMAVSEKIHALPKEEGLVPIEINYDTGKFKTSKITLGAHGDSYYEYLLTP